MVRACFAVMGCDRSRAAVRLSQNRNSWRSWTTPLLQVASNSNSCHPGLQRHHGQMGAHQAFNDGFKVSLVMLQTGLLGRGAHSIQPPRLKTNLLHKRQEKDTPAPACAQIPVPYQSGTCNGTFGISPRISNNPSPPICNDMHPGKASERACMQRSKASAVFLPLREGGTAHHTTQHSSHHSSAR